MNLEYIQAFRKVTQKVLGTYGFEEVCFEDFLVADQPVLRSRSLSVSISLHGGVEGRVVLIVPVREAASIASQVMQSQLSEEEAEDIRAVMAELANIVVGNATYELYSLGVEVDISPPTIDPGPEVKLHVPRSTDAVRVPILTRQGRFEMCLFLTPSSRPLARG